MSDGIDPTAVILERYSQGEISAPMALAQALLAHRDVAAVQAALCEPGGQAGVLTGAARELVRLLETNQDGAEQALAVLRMADAGSAASVAVDDGIAHCRRLFDQAVALNPEASVAVYSLGNADLLAAATG